jgi:uncharacterized protein (DUF1501 family)
MQLTRRQFLKGAAGAAALTLGPKFTRLPGTGVSYAAGPGDATVMFVQLFGGNDGINTVYPLDGSQRAAYEAARPTLKLPNTPAGLQPWVDGGFPAVSFNDLGVNNADGFRYAFHPAMGALTQVYGAGKVAVLPGAHYPFADHSHFRSMAIYWTADPLGPGTLGWFGRYLNSAGFTATDVPGVVLDGGVNPMFIPTQTSIFAFSDLGQLRYPADTDLTRKQNAFTEMYGLTPAVGSAYPELVKIGTTGSASIGKLLDYYKTGTGLANAGRVEALLLDDSGRYSRYNPLVCGSPLNLPKLDDMDLARDLRHVAATIRANVGARFFHVGIGGFDTHSNQEDGFWHSWLLYELSETVAAFHQEMGQAAALPGGYSGYLTGSQARRVIVVFFSEFGRTIHQNSTNPLVAGTDHATSAPIVVVGDPVIGGQFGAYPPLDNPADGYDDLRMTHDFRDVYGTILSRWLNVPAGTIGPGPGKILASTIPTDDNGQSYTSFTPIGFLAP